MNKEDQTFGSFPKDDLVPIELSPAIQSHDSLAKSNERLQNGELEQRAQVSKGDSYL